jgi:hypothetical protein
LDVLESLAILGPDGPGTLPTAAIFARQLKDRVFDVLPGGALTLNRVRVQKGKAPRGEAGGGIRNAGTTSLIFSDIVSCKSRKDGGGVANEGGSLAIDDTELTANKARRDGGSVHIAAGSVAFANVTINKSSAKQEGGGLYTAGGSVMLMDVSFGTNVAGKEGGAISVEGSALVTIVRCRIGVCRARVGGGISTRGATLGAGSTRVADTEFAGNRKANCAGELTNEGGNSASDDSCGF